MQQLTYKYFKKVLTTYQEHPLPFQPEDLQNPVRYHPQDLLPLPEGGLGFLNKLQEIVKHLFLKHLGKQ